MGVPKLRCYQPVVQIGQYHQLLTPHGWQRCLHHLWKDARREGKAERATRRCPPCFHYEPLREQSTQCHLMLLFGLKLGPSSLQGQNKQHCGEISSWRYSTSVCPSLAPVKASAKDDTEPPQQLPYHALPEFQNNALGNAQNKVGHNTDFIQGLCVGLSCGQAPDDK